MEVPKTQRQIDFCNQYIITGNAKKAALAAGYSASDPEKAGWRLKTRFQEYIQQAVKDNIGKMVPGALEIVNYLAINAESEQVRLKAAQDILDRAGYKPTNKTEQTVVSVEEKSTEELEAELASLIGQEIH